MSLLLSYGLMPRTVGHQLDATNIADQAKDSLTTRTTRLRLRKQIKY
jgi:hypothetical protein